MSDAFLSENDGRLAGAILRQWRHSEPENLDAAFVVFDKLVAIEARSKGAASHVIEVVVESMVRRGLGNHPRAAEVMLAQREARFNNARKSAQPGTGKFFSQLLQPASVIDREGATGLWHAVTGENLATFLKGMGPIDDELDVDPSTTQAAFAVLPWYAHVRLYRIRDPKWFDSNMIVYWLGNGEHLYRLAGGSPPIHRVNARAPLRLTDHYIVDYLKFFCFFVRGDDGPFYILESIDDPMLPVMPNDKVRQVMETVARPVEYHGLNAEGQFMVEAAVFYSNALFFGTFAINATGMVEMIDDEPIAADLPYKIVQPLATDAISQAQREAAKSGTTDVEDANSQSKG